jgi:hypothetical protein
MPVAFRKAGNPDGKATELRRAREIRLKGEYLRVAVKGIPVRVPTTSQINKPILKWVYLFGAGGGTRTLKP